MPPEGIRAMTTILLAIGDPDLRAACDSELSGAGLACLTLARPLAALTLASKVSWDAAVVDATPFGAGAMAALGALSMPSCVIGLGLVAPGVGLTLELPLR